MTPNEFVMRRIHLVASDPLPTRILDWPKQWTVHEKGIVRRYQIEKLYSVNDNFDAIEFHKVMPHRIREAA